MAQKVKIILVDDLDGGTADETVRFGLDGANYEMDLSTDNAEQLRDALKPFVSKARRSGSRSSSARSTRSGGGSGRNQDTARIREWARENGYTVSDRGRVHSDIQEAYRKAHGQ
ncbi:Lsr2 family protein [Tersicoccus solisilvae]|uniref:Lsr2 family protein n=1 Tax=Tersicoccus solisilvae TaxID=1882339 RepID=A0ABQ1PBA2_9MICC|nr:Lsr2 family protein [Tersicoccus solisilvae]GGC93682.1 Lsr2 family protein [Tersicoccus solisilvae]